MLSTSTTGIFSRTQCRMSASVWHMTPSTTSTTSTTPSTRRSAAPTSSAKFGWPGVSSAFTKKLFSREFGSTNDMGAALTESPRSRSSTCASV